MDGGLPEVRERSGGRGEFLQDAVGQILFFERADEDGGVARAGGRGVFAFDGRRQVKARRPAVQQEVELNRKEEIAAFAF